MTKRITSIVVVACMLLAYMSIPTHASSTEEMASPLTAFLNEATSSGFAYLFSGSDQVFDGTRCVQGSTEDINRLKASNQGTLLVRYQTLGDTNQIIFSAGSSTDVNSCGAILANAVSSVNQQRVQFPGGMQANLSETQADGGWHTFIYSVDASDLSNTTGKTVTSFDGSTTTQYPNYASWYNYNSSINNITFLNIGNSVNGMSGASGFVGRISAVVFVPRALTQQEAAALTASDWREDPELIYSAQNIQIDSSAQALTLGSDITGQIGALDEITIIAKYKNTNTGIGSLFSVSDPNEEISHFHLYQNNNVLGFEYRNNDEPYLATTCNVYPREWNTVAFTASKSNGYRLFANGTLGATLEETGSNYHFLSETITWTNCSIGKTVRSNDAVGYPFAGEIAYLEIYSGALPDATLLTRTSETQRTDSFVFYNGDNTGSTHFRIPFLWTTSNGTLLAGVDANFGSGGDSAENIDIAVRLKPNASQYGAMEGWQNAVVPDVMHMMDYADENGYDKIISGMVKRLNSRYYILGPGRGIQIQRGTYAGRIIVPVYYEGSPDCEVIYSDDCGATWTRGESVSSVLGLSEAAPVEMPDGSLKMFIRNTSILGGTVIEATSTDGGQSWTDVKCTFDNNSQGINCQMSAIVLSQTVKSKTDDLSYPALLLSCANTKNRENGRIFVGLIKDDGTYSNGSTKYRIDWEYQYDVTPAGTLFAYSCLSELSDGRIALLYESSNNSSWDDGLQKTFYREFELETLLN